jgi:hypothetical protein
MEYSFEHLKEIMDKVVNLGIYDTEREAIVYSKRKE